MPRKPDANNPYRVTIHKDKKYRYAATQPSHVNPDTGKKAYRLVHWGTVDEKLRFHPNARFLLASEEERTKLIFPENWDLSEIKVQCGLPEASKMLPVGQSDNRLYGNSWLLFEIAKITGVYEDLCIVFKDRLQHVNIILTIVFHLIIENSCCYNIEQWQRVQKLPYDDILTADFIADFIRSITKEHQEEMFRCRAVRLKQEEVCVVCLTSDSACGHSFGDIKFGHNKDYFPITQTIEVVVYTLERHCPAYYISYEKNVYDLRTLKKILKDVHDAGFKKLY